MGVLAPLWWMWYTTLYLYSHSWALAACVAAASSLYLAYRHLADRSSVGLQLSRPKIAKVVTNHATLSREVLQVLPVHPNNGWSLTSVSHGLRLFSRFFPAVGVADTPCLAATTVISVSPKKLLSIATNGRDIPCWVERVTMAPQYIRQAQGNPVADGDVIQLSFPSRNPEVGMVERSIGHLRRWGTNFTQKYANFLDGIFPIPTQFNTEIFEREWSLGRDGRGQVCWVARQPSKLPYHWSILVFNMSVKEKSQSIATLVMLPKSPEDRPLTSALLTSQLVALKDFSCLRRARVYSQTTPTGHVVPHNEGVESIQLGPQSSGRESPPQVPPRRPPAPLVLVPNGPLPSSVPTPDSAHSAAGSHTQQQHRQQQQQQQQQVHSQTSVTSDSTPAGPLPTATPPLQGSHSERLGRETCESLVKVAEATEQDGWTVVGMKTDIFVMKKPPEKGGPQVNCVKGTAIVRAPPEFVYRVLRDRENTPKLDDMLKESRLVERISDSVSLVQLLYRPVWPTSARDFLILVTSGRYDDTTLVDAAVSVLDPRVPEEKGYVRGNVVCGGYVVRAVSDQPKMCEVTYVSQAELKGNIPTFAVNKVTESQTMCVARLRSLAEEMYTALREDPRGMRELEEKVELVHIRPELTPPTLRPPTPPTEGGGDLGEGVREGGINLLPETTGVPSLPLTNGGEEDDVISSYAIVSTPPPVAMETKEEGDGLLVMEGLRTYTPDEITSEEEEEEIVVGGEMLTRHPHRQKPEEGEEAEVEIIRFETKLQPYPLPPSSPPVPADTEALTEESISFPRQESGGVDFRTLGNQTAARVLQELFHVSSLDPENLELFDNSSSGWKVIDVEKDIVILKKKIPGTPIFSFMGRGVIELPPRKVYDSVRNPQLRFTYDNMLKELHFVRNIENGLYVLHVHHETTQCFIKQSRDFCVLVNEREEGNKLLLVGLSVVIPECPVNPNVTRAKITYSGWVVEPRIIHGKTYSRVTYLLQVDLGGIPAPLVNHVSKRQPLAIAYLRDYLISTHTPS